MIALRAAGALALSLMGQQGLIRLVPAAHPYVDLMMLPVLRYSIARSQRSGLLVGCVAGLVEDAWFHAGVFGLSGFKKTLLGWVLGAFAARVELDQAQGWFVGGFVASLVDSLLDLGLRAVLDLPLAGVRPWLWMARALVLGTLAVAVFAAVNRAADAGRAPRAPARRW